jgi:hypothetical protein
MRSREEKRGDLMGSLQYIRSPLIRIVKENFRRLFYAVAIKTRCKVEESIFQPNLKNFAI